MTVAPQVFVVESLTAPRDPSMPDEHAGRLANGTGPANPVFAIGPPLAAFEWLWSAFRKPLITGFTITGATDMTTLPVPVAVPAVTWFALFPSTGTPAVKAVSATVPWRQPVPSYQLRFPVLSIRQVAGYGG